MTKTESEQHSVKQPNSVALFGSVRELGAAIRQANASKDQTPHHLRHLVYRTFWHEESARSR